MASSDGSTPTDAEQDAAQATARRGKTAAEQRQEAASTSEDPEVLSAEIERTREELAETLDAIADKVSPKRVAGRTRKKFGNAVKEGAEGARETLLAGAAAVKDAAGEAKGAVTDGDDAPLPAATPAAAPGGTAPTHPSPTPPPLHPVPTIPAGSGSGLGTPAAVGAVAAVLVALLVLRRRRR